MSHGVMQPQLMNVPANEQETYVGYNKCNIQARTCILRVLLVSIIKQLCCCSSICYQYQDTLLGSGLSVDSTLRAIYCLMSRAMVSM